MKRHRTMQQAEIATQLSLFDGHQDNDVAFSSALLETLQHIEAETSMSAEPKEAYERRRAAEMAEKLGWCSISLEKYWPDMKVIVAEGEPVWHAFLEEASSGTIGLIMLALHKILDPLTHDLIDGETGLHHRPVEVISQVEERLRSRMIRLAEALDWPYVSYWGANKVETIGPGEEIWQKYFLYGSFGRIAEAVGALERRARGEPDKTKRTSFHQSCDEEEN